MDRCLLISDPHILLFDSFHTDLYSGLVGGFTLSSHRHKCGPVPAIVARSRISQPAADPMEETIRFNCGMLRRVEQMLRLGASHPHLVQFHLHH